MVNKLTTLYVLEPFLIKPHEQIHLAEIALALNRPHPTIRQHLALLEKDGILKKNRKGKLSLYSLNFDNPSIVHYLTIAEKNVLIQKCKNDLLLKELLHTLHTALTENNKALIFGSATQLLKKANDIDLLITGKISKEKIEEFSNKFNTQVHLINTEKLKDITQALKEEILKKHLLIQGSEEILRWLLW